jgi:KDO2-lipid IV(A) lauroyltransferase
MKFNRDLRKKITRGIKYPVFIFFIKVFIRSVRFFPRRFILFTFGALGKLAFSWVPSESRRTIKVVEHIYKDKLSPKEIRKFGRSVFVHQAWNLADYFYTINLKTRQQFSKYWEIEGEEYLKAEYEKGKGVLCLMCHRGSWEFSAIAPPILGYETTAVSKALKNARINEMIIKYRQNRGMKNLSRGKTYPLLLEAIGKGECLIIMIDQDTQVKGVFVDFLGKQAWTPIGAARLAMDTKAPVVPMAMLRLPNNKHRFCIKPPIPLVDTGDYEADVLANTINYTKAIEAFVAEAPNQWVWMHERWRTTPEIVDSWEKETGKKFR